VADELHGNGRVVAPEGSKVRIWRCRRCCRGVRFLPRRGAAGGVHRGGPHVLSDAATLQYLCHFVGSTSTVGEWVTATYVVRDPRKVTEYLARLVSGKAHRERWPGLTRGRGRRRNR
jgi:hypothetical protein